MLIPTRKTITTTLQKTPFPERKAILLNSLILSKVTFLSNIFPIPNTVQKQIETNIFRHTWQFSEREPIARKKTLF